MKSGRPFYETRYANGSRFVGGSLVHPMWGNAPEGIISLNVLMPTGDWFSLVDYEWYSLVVGASTALVSGGGHRTVHRHVFAMGRRGGQTTCYLMELGSCAVSVIPAPGWRGLVWKRGATGERLHRGDFLAL
jgi:hypothetical protein